MKDYDSIASVAKVSRFEAEEEVLLDEEGNVIETPQDITKETPSEEDIDTNDENNNQNENNDEEN